MYKGVRMRLREAIAIASDPVSVMQRVLAEALVLVPSAEGAVIELCAKRTSLVIAAASGNVADSVGSVLSVAHSLSGLAIRSGVTQRCHDATTDPRVDATLAAELGILSMICVPLRRGDERIGVLNITSSEASAFGSADEASLAGLAHFVSSMIAAAVELASCTAELLGPCQVAAAATLGQGHLGGSSEAARARSAFVANVVRPGTAFDSAVRDRIEQVLTGTGSRLYSSRSSRFRAEKSSRSKHSHASHPHRSVDRIAGLPRRPRSGSVARSSSVRSSGPSPFCLSCPSRSAWQ